MMTALGPCSALASDTFIFINELTTVAGVSALALFMASATSLGSASTDSPALASAFALATELVNTSSGATRGNGVPSAATVPTSLINTLGDIVASCVNSAGGTAGDATPCGQFFSLTSSVSGAAPTDTIAALLSLANHPALNTVALFQLTSPASPFRQTQPPHARRHPACSGLVRGWRWRCHTRYQGIRIRYKFNRFLEPDRPSNPVRQLRGTHGDWRVRLARERSSNAGLRIDSASHRRDGKPGPEF